MKDTTSPSWDQEINDLHLDYGESLEYQLNASDLSGIDRWTVNNTELFTISSAGKLTNNSKLEVGSYPLCIRVYDEFDNELSVNFTVYIEESGTTTTTTTATSTTTTTTTTTTDTDTTSTGDTSILPPPDDGTMILIVAVTGVSGALVVCVIVIMLRNRRSK